MKHSKKVWQLLLLQIVDIFTTKQNFKYDEDLNFKLAMKLKILNYLGIYLKN